MAFDIKNFATDKDKELEGVWEDLGQGARVLVARAGNRNFAAGYGAIPSGVRRLLEKDALDPAAADATLCKLLAETILLGWEGMLEGEKEVKYSKEVAAEMLVKYPDFRQFIWDLANDFQRFHDEAKNETLKNSKSV